MISLTRKIYKIKSNEKHFIHTSSQAVEYLLEFHIPEIEKKESYNLYFKEISLFCDNNYNAKDKIEFCELLLNKLFEISNSAMGVCYLGDKDSSYIHPVAAIGADLDILSPIDFKTLGGDYARSSLSKDIIVSKTTSFKISSFMGDLQPVESITIPLFCLNECSGFISMASTEPYNEIFIQALKDSLYLLSLTFNSVIITNEIMSLYKVIREISFDRDQKANEKENYLKEQKNLQNKITKLSNLLTDEKEKSLEAERLKTQILSTISHELRTPLNSINSLSRVLLRKSNEHLSSDEKGYLEIISRNGEELLHLINDILDLSRIETGKLELKIRPFNFINLIRTVIENNELGARGKEISINLDSQLTISDIVSDEARVYQILQNIINNAVKFTEDGSVSIHLSNDEQNISIKIIDTGLGIKESDLETIFEEFKQLHRSTHQEGSGLGLTIARKSARILNGDISVESKVDTGSTFYITLPINFSQPEDVPLALNKNFNKKLLIIDDDKDSIISLKAILSEFITIEYAHDGESGLDKAIEMVPEVILLDMALPKMNGFMVAERLKKNDRTKNIPIIAITALSTASDKDRILKSGCNDHLPKPYDIDELTAKVSYWIKKNE